MHVIDLIVKILSMYVTIKKNSTKKNNTENPVLILFYYLFYLFFIWMFAIEKICHYFHFIMILQST